MRLKNEIKKGLESDLKKKKSNLIPFRRVAILMAHNELNSIFF